MIPKLKVSRVAWSSAETEPRVLSRFICGRRVLCGVLRTSGLPTGKAREQIRLCLANALLKRHCELTDRNARRLSGSVDLRKDRLGKPHLVAVGHNEVSISFTHVPGTSWAALCSDAQVGIDAAESRDFQGYYPFHRAFHEAEFHPVLAAAGGVEEAAALIWSAKEAAVKAVGVGFHLIDPLDVKIRIVSLEKGWVSLEARLEGKPKERISHVLGTMEVRAFRYRDGWICVALTTGGSESQARNDMTHLSDVSKLSPSPSPCR